MFYKSAHIWQLTIDGSTEEDEQPVYLVKTYEGGYAKFMVKEFKPDAPILNKLLLCGKL